MNPRLYQPTTKDFSNNGIGVLSDAAFCEVTEERNGILELVLDYPINGIHFSEIKQRSIITAKPNPTADAQPFRVYRVTKPLNGMVTVFAQHISYDLSGIAVTPFSAGSAAAALQALKTNSVVENPFEFWTDKSTVAEMNVKTPASVRAMLGGVQGSVLDTYGGEYEWDGFTVKLHNQRGQNRGVSIRYGKNLTDLEQEENCANVYTAVMPFWADSEGNCTMLNEKIVEVEGNFDFVRVLTLDLSGEFENQPTQEELRSRAQSYIKINKIGVPKVSLRVSFVPLEQTEEYKNIALLERVNLCDAVNVEFEKLGVSATAKVIKTVYNVLLDRYESVELGDAKSNIADTLVKQEQAIKDAPKKAMSMVAQAAENATQIITGNRGGYVVIHSSTGASEPDEILIMDKPTIEEAVKVWRWNNSGLGYSENGYPGPYTSAWTIDGAFNADFITAGTISANLIKSGLLQSLNGQTTFDMDDGTITIKLADASEMVLSFDGIAHYRNNEVSSFYNGTQIKTNYGDFDFITLHEPGLGKQAGIIGPGYIDLKRNTDAAVASVSLSSGENGGGSLAIYKVEGNIGIPLCLLSADENLGGSLKINTGENKTIAEIANNSSNLGGYFRANNAEQEERATMWVTSNDSGILTLKNTNNVNFATLSNVSGSGAQLDLCNESGTVTAQLKNKSGAGGQLELRNESGKATFSFSNASGGGAECWIGQGNSVYKLFDYKNGTNLYVDHIKFYGKNYNFINYLGGSSANADPDEYSAFLVCGIPASGRRQSTVLIPSARTGNYQIADEDYYLDISYDGSTIKKGTAGTETSAIQAIYGIR